MGRHTVKIEALSKNSKRRYRFNQKVSFDLQVVKFKIRYLLTFDTFRYFILIALYPRRLKRIYFLINDIGFKQFLIQSRRHSWNVYTCDLMYQNGVRKNHQTIEARKQRQEVFSCRPKISIVVPTFNTPKRMLMDMMSSVMSQTYSHWELCIADGSDKDHTYVRDVLQQFANKDKRIKLTFLESNKGIAKNSNEAISLASGGFVAFLDHDDVLSPEALFHIVDVINKESDVDFIYSDEDHISEDGKMRLLPFFKPDFSPDLLRSHNYITHFLVLKISLGQSCGWFRDGFDGAQDYDLVLRASEKAAKIVHIPKILYHWRDHSNSTSKNLKSKPYAHQAGEKALQEHLERVGLKAKVENSGYPFRYRTRYSLSKEPLVSIIIPNKDEGATLKKCIHSIVETSTYKNIEILIVENGSSQKSTFELYSSLQMNKKIRVIEWNYPFNFSGLNNFAVNKARGEVILLLNNDTEAINPDWIENMLEYALRPDVGAVGAKLYYPDGTIQHGGVIIGLGGLAGHSHKNFSKDEGGYYGRLEIVQNLSAVTAACLMMRKSIFIEVGGFDETLAVAFNDVDLCLNMRNKGYLIVWTPYAKLYHFESKTRGYEDTLEKMERFEKEKHIIMNRWSEILLKGDPYYNPNLTLDREDFSFKNWGVY
ncbi:MAG: glycosyltransferase family 2 protein [Candidatus Omnitrophica bacterium]|nr:glycosyltransferase family 2 protein [Candidatus Omnitrophota bacterium]